MNNSNYISHFVKSEETSYFGTDNGTETNTNPNWNLNFNYKWNSLGFRSKELNNLPGLVSFGCSNTVGVGVPEEMRFSRIVSDSLNLQDFSFANGGSDHYQVFHNILIFLKSHVTIIDVKLAIILWPERARFTWAYDSGSEIRIKTELPFSIKKDSWQENFMYYWGEHVAYPYQLLMMEATDRLFKSYNIPLKQISQNKLPNNFKYIDSLIYDDIMYDEFDKLRPLDRGRDLHIGPETHKLIANYFLSK